MFNHIYSRYQNNPMDTVQRVIGGIFTAAGSIILMSPFFIPVSLPVFFLGLCLLLSGPAYFFGESIYEDFKKHPGAVAVLSVFALAGLSILALPFFTLIPLGLELCGLLMATITPYLYFYTEEANIRNNTQASRSRSNFSRYDSDYYHNDTEYRSGHHDSGVSSGHHDSSSYDWQDTHVTYY